MTRRHDNAQQNLKEAASVTAASGLAEVSGTLRSIATARRPDHIDEYTLATRVAATPDQWAKASKDMLHEAAADFAEGSHATGVGTGT